MSLQHVDIHPEAIAEAQAATKWYREKSPSADEKPLRGNRAHLPQVPEDNGTSEFV